MDFHRKLDISTGTTLLGFGLPVRYSSYTRGRQLRSMLRFAHTGEVGGIIGQTIAGLVSTGGAMLVFTGLLLALRRFGTWVANRSRSLKPALSDISNPVHHATGD